MDNYYPDFHGQTNDFGDDVGKDYARLVPQCRMYQRDDLTKLVDISKTCFTGERRTHVWNRSDFIRAANNGISIAVRMDEVGRSVGFVAYQWNPTYFRIWNIAVLPGLQKRGHGTGMINHVLGRMKPMRQTLLLAEVSYVLPDAMAFLFNRGFRRRETRHAGDLPVSAIFVLKLADTYQKYQAANVDLPNVGSPIAAP